VWGWEVLQKSGIFDDTTEGLPPTLMKSFFRRLWQEESGQDMVEYSLLLAFIVVCAAAVMTSTRVQISTIWSTISSSLSSAVNDASS
jgi:Flp pilus assembly pilin Flp